MRLDHLLSMETMRSFHGDFVVRLTSEVLSEASTELLLFNFQGSARSLKKQPGNGGVAQLGEHLPCKQGVMGSNPIISTSRHMLTKMEEPIPNE